MQLDPSFRQPTHVIGNAITGKLQQQQKPLKMANTNRVLARKAAPSKAAAQKQQRSKAKLAKSVSMPKLSGSSGATAVTSVKTQQLLPRGLCNLGNTCYVNCVVQALR
jgi:ubiquitin C-terminal hydrolase